MEMRICTLKAPARTYMRACRVLFNSRLNNFTSGYQVEPFGFSECTAPAL